MGRLGFRVRRGTFGGTPLGSQARREQGGCLGGRQHTRKPRKKLGLGEQNSSNGVDSDDPYLGPRSPPRRTHAGGPGRAKRDSVGELETQGWRWRREANAGAAAAGAAAVSTVRGNGSRGRVLGHGSSQGRSAVRRRAGTPEHCTWDSGLGACAARAGMDPPSPGIRARRRCHHPCAVPGLRASRHAWCLTLTRRRERRAPRPSGACDAFVVAPRDDEVAGLGARGVGSQPGRAGGGHTPIGCVRGAWVGEAGARGQMASDDRGGAAGLPRDMRTRDGWGRRRPARGEGGAHGALSSVVRASVRGVGRGEGDPGTGGVTADSVPRVRGRWRLTRPCFVLTARSGASVGRAAGQGAGRAGLVGRARGRGACIGPRCGGMKARARVALAREGSEARRGGLGAGHTNGGDGVRAETRQAKAVHVQRGRGA